MIPIPTTIFSSRSQLYVSTTITSIKTCIQEEGSLNLDGIPTTQSEVFISFLLFQMNVILVP
jgi:2-methylaconitate cis-trans-isomerase PrpF